MFKGNINTRLFNEKIQHLFETEFFCNKKVKSWYKTQTFWKVVCISKQLIVIKNVLWQKAELKITKIHFYIMVCHNQTKTVSIILVTQN